MVTQTDINEFQALYEARFGIRLEPFEARAKLELLVRQMELVYRPVTRRQLESINVNEKHREQSKSQPAAN